MLSLCALLSQVYDRVVSAADTIATSPRLLDLLLSIDTTLTKRVVQCISEDMHAIAIDLLREQQQNIATLFSSELLLPTLFGMEKKSPLVLATEQEMNT